MALSYQHRLWLLGVWGQRAAAVEYGAATKREWLPWTELYKMLAFRPGQTVAAAFAGDKEGNLLHDPDVSPVIDGCAIKQPQGVVHSPAKGLPVAALRPAGRQNGWLLSWSVSVYRICLR